MRRRIIAVLAISVLALMPAMAAWGDSMTINGEVTANPFSRLFDFLEMVFFGAAAGLLLGAKFFIDIVKAYYRSDESPEAMKKAVMRFALTVIICLIASGVLFYVTGIASAS